MVLEGWDGEVPRLRPPRRAATLRQLATHTSGLVYEFWNPDLLRWRQITRAPSAPSGRLEGLNYPLLFDPGERWGYGIGPDWLGQVVEAVDGRRIDRFCEEEIFEPLGMRETVFELTPALAARRAAVVVRGADGGFEATDAAPPSRPEFYGMGHALHGTGGDYLRFLRMLLGRGALDGTRVLSEAAVAELLANQIGGLGISRMESVVPATVDFELFPGTRKGHSLAFMRVEEDVAGMRAAGAQGWAGILNTHCWIDPARDVAGLFLTQVRPFGDARVMAAFRDFERAVYAG
jgi:CubicO group peptidase (beta-lactamase class C family)